MPTTIKNPELLEKVLEQLVRAVIRLFTQEGFHKKTPGDFAEERLRRGHVYGIIENQDYIFLLHELLADRISRELEHTVEGGRDSLEKLSRIVGKVYWLRSRSDSDKTFRIVTSSFA